MKLKKQIIYSSLLLMIASLLLFALTLGWISKEVNSFNELDLYYGGTVFNYFHTADDGSGRPMEDEDGYVWIEDNANSLVFENYFPMKSTMFKLTVHPSTENGKSSFYLSDISDPYIAPGVDIADAFFIKYTHPITGMVIDKRFTDPEIMDAGRRITVFENFDLGIEENYTFEYMIYMAPDAGNIFKTKQMTIKNVLFTVTYN